MENLCMGFLPVTQKRKSPVLLARGAQGEDLKIPLSGNVYLEFSEGTMCIGHFDGSRHYECPEMKTGVRQCRECARNDIKNAYTFGDFSKYPELYEKSLKTKYSIYLAQFGSQIQKVGLARSERFAERLCEQGADFGSVVAEFTGPEPAYAAELAISGRFGFRTAVSSKLKIQSLLFDRQLGRMIFQKAIDAMFSSELPLSESPVPEVLEFSDFYPKIQKVPKKSNCISGTVDGTKGMLLFYSGAGGSRWIDMKDCVGRAFEEKKPEPGGQSSLFDYG